MYIVKAPANTGYILQPQEVNSKGKHPKIFLELTLLILCFHIWIELAVVIFYAIGSQDLFTL